MINVINKNNIESNFQVSKESVDDFGPYVGQFDIEKNGKKENFEISTTREQMKSFFLDFAEMIKDDYPRYDRQKAANLFDQTAIIIRNDLDSGFNELVGGTLDRRRKRYNNTDKLDVQNGDIEGEYIRLLFNPVGMAMTAVGEIEDPNNAELLEKESRRTFYHEITHLMQAMFKEGEMSDSMHNQYLNTEKIIRKKANLTLINCGLAMGAVIFAPFAFIDNAPLAIGSVASSLGAFGVNLNRITKKTPNEIRKEEYAKMYETNWVEVDAVRSEKIAAEKDLPSPFVIRKV